MDIVAWALIFPLGILVSGIMSFNKRKWLGVVPTIIFSILFLSFHYVSNFTVNYIGDIFLILVITSVVINLCCQLVFFLVKSKKRTINNSNVKKSKVQDL